MLRGDDGAYYGLINVAGSNAVQAGGNCFFRVEGGGDEADPSNYRGWNGSAFSVAWHSAYKAGRAGSSGVCATQPVNSTTPFSEHVSFRRLVPASDGWPTFMAFGPGKVGGVRYSFSWEPDFAKAIVGEWAGPRFLDLNARRWMGPKDPVEYPVLLDAASPSLGGVAGGPDPAEDAVNFALLSNASTAGLYFVAGGSRGRNILRATVHFRTTAPAPPVPPSQGLLPLSCRRVSVSGAGTVGANGAYTLVSGPKPQWKKDETHQLYQFQGMWKIAHYGVADSELYVSSVANTTTPTLAQWCLSGGEAPAPAALRCMDADV